MFPASFTLTMRDTKWIFLAHQFQRAILNFVATKLNFPRMDIVAPILLRLRKKFSMKRELLGPINQLMNASTTLKSVRTSRCSHTLSTCCTISVSTLMYGLVSASCMSVRQMAQQLSKRRLKICVQRAISMSLKEPSGLSQQTSVMTKTACSLKLMVRTHILRLISLITKTNLTVVLTALSISGVPTTTVMLPA